MTEYTPEQISEYDIVLAVDLSGSMASQSKKVSGNLLQEVKEFTLGLANFASSVDDDGITLITFGGSNVNVVDNVTTEKVEEAFNNMQIGGSTPTGKAVKAAFDKHFSNGKSTFVFVMTDGAATDAEDLVNVLVDGANKIGKNEELCVQLIQVGNDPQASEFLRFLDDDLGKRGAKHDIVNTLTAQEAEGLSFGRLFWLALND